MISFSQAKQITNDHATLLPSESAALPNSLHRILAKDVVSDIDMPISNMSAMDGYACRKADLGEPLEEIETIPAGYMPQKTVKQGECAKIMTGAMVPQGADTVVMVEHTREKDGKVEVIKQTGRSNIRVQAEDIKAGEVVVSAGSRITPVEIAVLAGAGRASVEVSCVPRVGVIATGDELVEPGETLHGAKIRNSNAYQLCAQVERMGCRPHYIGIARDTPEALDVLIKQSLSQCDVLLLSGGVSVGDFDYVPQVLRENAIKLLFEKVSVKPGKPTVFGTGQGKFFFGLPGNPVSTFVLFEVLVKPFLFQLMGHTFTPLTLRVQVEKTIQKKKADRSEFIPIQLSGQGTVQDFAYHGSAHIHAYTQANAIMSIPSGAEVIEQGETVEVILL